jgi:G3E family GTPase
MHRRLPVTLIGGFLGAGKTSLLHHFITEYSGGHLALLVENPAPLNPDTAALRGLCGAMGRKYDTIDELAPGDGENVVLAKVQSFAEAGRYERALVEVSGTTNAARWARTLRASPWVELEQIVCVVDLLDFHHTFVQTNSASMTESLREFQRGQTEEATLIVLNKCDLLGDAERHQGSRLLRSMNRAAQIIETDYSEVPPGLLLQPATPAKDDDGPRGEYATGAPPLAGVVYRAHRPFHPARLWAWFNALHPGLLRVKGIVWLATRNLLVGGVSRTLWQNGCGAAGIWWAALPREEWPTKHAALAEMQDNWREPFGDRRQELVLIGERVATETAARQLNNCLLTAAEYARPVAEWRQFPDPFPEWNLEQD